MFNVIIWATDGCSEAENALRYARGLAQAEDARLVVVHVDEFGLGRGGSYSIAVEEAEIQAVIRKQVEDMRRDGLRVTFRVPRVGVGAAAQAIAEIAKQEGADLIVTGARGHSPLSSLLLGSVPHRLTRWATCPVMVVPQQARRGAPRRRPVDSADQLTRQEGEAGNTRS
jgi:nucleotide-binding universal stress UspA family protein